MLLDEMIANIDYVAFAVLVAGIVLTIIVRRFAENPKRSNQPMKPEDTDKYKHLFVHEARLSEVLAAITSKSLRKAYRRNWAERIIAQKAYPEARETIRNLIMTNTTLLSAVLVSFGLLLTGYSFLHQVGGSFSDIKMISLSVLLIYSLFMLISEIRILNYIPIVLWVDDEVIELKQKIEKSMYIASLMDDAFDRFSDAIRAVFYAVVCIFWFFNVYVFIVGVIILTAVIISSDLDKQLKITIF